jgi:hypothetical protein
VEAAVVAEVIAERGEEYLFADSLISLTTS